MTETPRAAAVSASNPAASPAPNAAPNAAPVTASPADTATVLASLQAWAEAGWLRRLDSAFAHFLADACPSTPPALLLAAALLAHLEGRGHSCLRLDSLLHDADTLLAWPADGSAALQRLLATLPAAPAAWLALLQTSPLVAVEQAGRPSPASATPLVLVLDANPTPLVLDGDTTPLVLDANPTPLVLCGSSLYLRRYRTYERQIAAQVLQRASHPQVVDSALARRWLGRLFPPAAGTPPALEPDPSDPAPHLDWQQAACALALRGGLTVITGGPGTGKTHTAARLLALRWAMHPTPALLRVALAAPTGKAAARLQQSISAALHRLQPGLAGDLPLRSLASHIGPASTLHRLLGARPDTRRLQADAAHPLALDLLIVDEASMVHLEMMAALLAALPAHASLVLLGDKDQLASVEAGAVLGDLCHRAAEGRYQPDTAAWLASVTGSALPAALLGPGPALAQHTVMLRRSHRFGGPIGALARAVNSGDAATANALLAGPSGQSGQSGQSGPALMVVDASNPAALLRLALHGRPGAEGGYSSYLQLLQQRPAPLVPADPPVDPSDQAPANPATHSTWVRAVLQAFDGFRLLCAVRDGAWGSIGLNQAVERALAQQGLIQRRGEWYAGRPVMVTRNDPGLGVFNGDIGIVLQPATSGTPLRAYFLDGDALRSVSVARLVAVETAFAMTVHKSQGSEFGHTVLVLPPEPGRGLSREGVYTGITRARNAFTLACGRPTALADAIHRPTRRASGLLALLGDDVADSDTAAAPPA